MVYAFDALSYARHLRQYGVPQDQAEAHAEAARKFIMAELVTKTDLSRLEAKIDTQTLRLTVRLGGLLVVGVGVLAGLLKLV